MTSRRRTPLAIGGMGALLAVGLALASCGGASTGQGLAHAESTCVVARGDTVVLTLADSEALRRIQGPAVTPEEGTRLAVDAVLASWLEHGEVPDDDAERLEALRSQSLRLSSDATLRERELERARQALGLRTGPCFVARS